MINETNCARLVQWKSLPSFHEPNGKCNKNQLIMFSFNYSLNIQYFIKTCPESSHILVKQRFIGCMRVVAVRDFHHLKSVDPSCANFCFALESIVATTHVMSTSLSFAILVETITLVLQHSRVLDVFGQDKKTCKYKFHEKC